jgi:hypothetical protein
MNHDDPRMTTVECGLTRYEYGLGRNGLQIAEGAVTASIEVLIDVLVARAHDPTTYPCYGEASPQDTARRIVARLLDAGWRPPDAECLDLPNVPEVTQ